MALFVPVAIGRNNCFGFGSVFPQSFEKRSIKVDNVDVGCVKINILLILFVFVLQFLSVILSSPSC